MRIEQQFSEIHLGQINRFIPNPFEFTYKGDNVTIIHFSTKDSFIAVSKLIMPENYIYIRGFYVPPKYRRKGIGSHVISELIKSTKENKVSYLQLEATIKSIPFWEKLGFVFTGEETKDGDKIYILKLN